MTYLKVVKLLGQGGFGRALLVLTETGEQKVLKEVCTERLSEVKQRAVSQEINTLKLMKHANIIRYERHFFKDGNTYILMEYANRGDLSEFIRNRRGEKIAEDTIVDWFVQMCLALKYVHDRKIIHRDVKPANFFLTDLGIVKLGDFGLATFLQNTNALLQTSIGTPFYLAPEVCRGQRYNQKADVWALGCVLYEMCTLKRAFYGFSVKDLLIQIQYRTPPRLPSSYSPELRALLSHMLRKNPDERPTVNQILTLPFMRFKAYALLGKTQAKCEFSHTVFHGVTPGQTPANAADEITILNEQMALIKAIKECYENENDVEEEGIPEEEKIEFMGRTLILKNVGPDSSPQSKAESLRAFIEEILGVARFRDLYLAISNGKAEEIVTKTDTWASELIIRLIACEEAITQTNK